MANLCSEKNMAIGTYLIIKPGNKFTEFGHLIYKPCPIVNLWGEFQVVYGPNLGERLNMLFTDPSYTLVIP